MLTLISYFLWYCGYFLKQCALQSLKYQSKGDSVGRVTGEDSRSSDLD